MAEKQAQTILDLDAMMDMEMDKVETLPDFVTPPNGLYKLKIEKASIEKYLPKATPENKSPKEQGRFKILYSVVATVETSDTPVKDGALFSESFMGTQQGLEYFKRQALNILNVPDLVGASVKDVLDTLVNQEFDAKITVKQTANPAGGFYENLQIRPMHAAATA